MNDAAAAPAAFTPKPLRLITVPLIKMNKAGDTVHILCEKAIFQARDNARSEQKDDSGKKKEPPFLLQGVDLTSDRPCQIIVGAILKDTLTAEYPDDGYVGHAFTITLTEQKRGRGNTNNYNLYSITEIEVPEKYRKHAEGKTKK